MSSGSWKAEKWQNQESSEGTVALFPELHSLGKKKNETNQVYMKNYFGDDCGEW